MHMALSEMLATTCGCTVALQAFLVHILERDLMQTTTCAAAIQTYGVLRRSKIFGAKLCRIQWHFDAKLGVGHAGGF